MCVDSALGSAPRVCTLVHVGSAVCLGSELECMLVLTVKVHLYNSLGWSDRIEPSRTTAELTRRVEFFNMKLGRFDCT